MPATAEPMMGYIELPQREFDLRATLRPVLRHLIMIAAITVGVVTLSGLRVSMTPRVYTASSTVLIKPRAPDTMAFRGDLADSDAAEELYDNFYKTQYSVLRSRSLAASVIQSENLQAVFAHAQGRAQPSWWMRIHAMLYQRVKQILGMHPATKLASPPAPLSTVSASPGVPSAMIDAYLGGLTISPVADTSLVQISYTYSDPVVAAEIANAHAQAYIREGIELQNQTNVAAQRFLQQRLVDLKEKLERSEQALNDFRRQNGIVPGLMSVDGKNAIVLDRLAELSHDLTQAQVHLLALQASADLIHRHSYDSLPQVVKDPAIMQLQEQITHLQTEYAGMAQQFKPDFPPLAELAAKLAQARRTLSQQIGVVISGLEAEYQQAQDNVNKLQAELDNERSMALKLNDAAAQYSILQREVETNRQLYDAVLQRIKDLGVSEGSQASNVSIVDQAEVPRTPSAPKVRQTILLSVVLGLSGGVALAFLLDYLDNTLKDGEEVERYLRLPSLVTVPNFSQVSSRGGYSSRYLEPPEEPEQVSGELVLSTGNFSRATEAYRVLRTRILLSRAGQPPRSLLFTSATPAEGKTVTAINAGIIFSQLGVRVLIIDADLRHPRAHEVLRMSNEAGLTEVLTGQVGVLDVLRAVPAARKAAPPSRSMSEPVTQSENAVETDSWLADIRRRLAQERAQAALHGNNGHPETGTPEPVDFLYLLSSGSLPPNPSELLGSPKMLETLNFLEQHFDYIVVDSPPIMPVSDSIVLSTIMDGVIVVVDQQRTPKQVVKTACSRLEYARAHVLGTVLNKVNLQQIHAYSYYDHYYHSDYSNDY